MGAFISLPVKNDVVSYEAARELTLTGKRKETQTVSDTPKNFFEVMTEQLFDPILQKRLEVLDAQAKFQHLDREKLQELYPQWTFDHILDLKSQFQTFDVNQDGLIDFHELCNVLDELGDTSDVPTREQYFAELDEDGSGAVDFGEYLGFLNFICKKKRRMSALGLMAQAGSQNAQKIRKLSIVQQIDHGLF